MFLTKDDLHSLKNEIKVLRYELEAVRAEMKTSSSTIIEMKHELTALKELTATWMSALNEETMHTREVLLNLTTFMHEKYLDDADIEKIVKGAWVDAKPDASLTWNVEMTGKEFIDNVAKFGGESLGNVMEVGPGYGRLLKEVTARGLAFDSWLGVDISEQNVAHLKGEFEDDKISFLHADVLKHSFDQSFDTVISSAVFMHLYPDVSNIAAVCHKVLGPGGKVFFDVPEGSGSYIDPTRNLFVKHYLPDELKAFLTAAGFSKVDVIEQPEFLPGTVGLFVCGEK